MKKGYFCPKCGNLEAMKLAITTLNGNSLTVHLASQAAINRRDTLISCLKCKHVAAADEFRKKRR